MSICKKCGHELKPDALYCNKCGCEIEKVSIVPDLSLEESLDLVETLQTKYTEIKELETEISDCEYKLSHPLVHGRVPTHFFRYFWKFMLVSGISFVVFSWYGFALGLSNFPWPEVIMPFFFSITAGIFIFGLIYSIRRSNAEAVAIDEYNEKEQQDRKELRTKSRELKERLAECESDLIKLDWAIPEKYRNTRSMKTLKFIMESGKASDLREAINYLSH